MTIKDIAELANVSVSTVSKILNHKDKDIGEDTRKKVLKIIKEYQYEPYSKVREKNDARTYLVGIILPQDFICREELLKGLREKLQAEGYNLVVYDTYSHEEEEKYIQILAGRRMDAALVYSIGSGRTAVRELEKAQIPLILLKRDETVKTASQIYVDPVRAGYLAAGHLLKSGHRNIGLLIGDSEYGRRIRDGYIQALYEAEILYEEEKVYIGQNDLEAGKTGAHQLINQDVTAVVCENEKMALAAYQTCGRHATQVPGDLSIVSAGYSGLAEAFTPVLTAINLGMKELGETAADAVLKRLESGSGEIQKEIMPFLIEGESVSSPRIRGLGQNRKLIVVGSMNIDVIVNVNKLPTDGETLLSENMTLLPGGKGANQAVGVGRMGGTVYAVGCLGNDNDGKKLYHSLVENSVKTAGIQFSNTLPTGKAYINVADNGEGTIVVYRGANNELDEQQLRKYQCLFEEAAYCLLSLEITAAAAEYAIKLCRKHRVKVIVKPSAADELRDTTLRMIDYLIPNEKELHHLVPGSGSIEEKANILFGKGVQHVIVTLGNRGCYLKDQEYELYFEAAPFEALDTTGAADAMISALAVYLNEEMDLISAIEFAEYAAGISITRQGALPSMPDRMTVDVYKDEILNEVKRIKENIEGKGSAGRG